MSKICEHDWKQPKCVRCQLKTPTEKCLLFSDKMFSEKRGNGGGVLDWFPMVEHGPSVCSASEMRWNFYDLCLEIGPLQLKTGAGYSMENQCKYECRGLYWHNVQWDSIALQWTPVRTSGPHGATSTQQHFSLKQTSSRIKFCRSQFFGNKEEAACVFKLFTSLLKKMQGFMVL